MVSSENPYRYEPTSEHCAAVSLWTDCRIVSRFLLAFAAFGVLAMQACNYAASDAMLTQNPGWQSVTHAALWASEFASDVSVASFTGWLVLFVADWIDDMRKMRSN